MTGPAKFGRYALLDRLATGGMGELFLAELEGAGDFRKLVVIKRLLPHLADNPEFEALFFNEARIAAQLSHPNVCHVYELDRAANQYYIAMEYLEGTSLAVFCKDHRLQRLGETWSIALVTSLFYQFCEGLHHVHELTGPDGAPLGIVHRDISPANLFVTTSGVGKVLDFGIAKIRAAVLEERSSLKGKFPYMSPEQLRGEPLDRRSDVFSLGCVLFEALTGTRLFARDNDMLVAHAILGGEARDARPLRADVPDALDEVLRCALALDRANRFDSARALGDAVLDAAGGGMLPAGRIASVLAPAMERHLAQRRASLAALAGDPAEPLAAAHPTALGSARTTPFPSGARASEASSASFDEQSVRSIGSNMHSDVHSLGITRPSTPGMRPSAPSVMPSTPPAFAAYGGAHPSTVVLPPQAPIGPHPRAKRIAIIAAAALITMAIPIAISLALRPTPAPVGLRTAPSVRETLPSSAQAAPGAATQTPAVAPTEPVPPSAPAEPLPSPEPLRPPLAPPPRSEMSEPVSTAAPEPRSPPKPAATSAAPGFLSVASSPFATIWVDGKRLGDTPLYKVSLSPGRHTLRAVSGAQNQALTVEIQSGKVTIRRITW